MLPGEEWIIRRDLVDLYDQSGEAGAARAERQRATVILTRLMQALQPSAAEGLHRAQLELSSK